MCAFFVDNIKFAKKNENNIKYKIKLVMLEKYRSIFILMIGIFIHWQIRKDVERTLL